MAKYTDDVKALLELIGGKENIAAVSHCMTRMRFVLADEKKEETPPSSSSSSSGGSSSGAWSFAPTRLFCHSTTSQLPGANVSENASAAKR